MAKQSKNLNFRNDNDMKLEIKESNYGNDYEKVGYGLWTEIFIVSFILVQGFTLSRLYSSSASYIWIITIIVVIVRFFYSVLNYLNGKRKENIIESYYSGESLNTIDEKIRDQVDYYFDKGQILSKRFEKEFSREFSREFENIKKQLKDYRENFLKELKTDEVTNKIFEKFYEEIDSLRDEITELEKKAIWGPEIDQEGLLKELKRRIFDSANKEIIEQISDKIKFLIDRESLQVPNAIQDRHSEMKGRLEAEILVLGRRGNVNLAIGGGLSILGIVILGYSVFLLQSKIPELDMKLFLLTFVPKVSLVLLIELFSFFFLRLYKSSLFEIKFFQNELTNVEEKYISLIASFSVSSEAVESVIEKVSQTERNRFLEKGQTTVEIETSKVDKEFLKEVTKNIVSIFPSKKENLSSNEK